MLNTRLAVPRLHRSLAARMRGGCDAVLNQQLNLCRV